MAERKTRTGFQTGSGKRSPLKLKPLHNPGESTQQEMERLLGEEFFPLAMGTLTVVVFAAYEWSRWCFSIPPQPIALTIVATGMVVYLMHRFRTTFRRYRALRQGSEGEKAVGQYLESLRANGYQVFHDIEGDGFNLDHVLVCVHGVFVIETKTYSKPARGTATVVFDGERVVVDGFEPDRNAATQVRALSKWFRDMLSECTGREFPVRGVVLLPGWYVETRAGRKPDIWVLNPKALPSFIAHEPVMLKDEDVALICSRITLHAQDR